MKRTKEIYNRTGRWWNLRMLFLILSISHFLIFFSCARMGTPDGGWYDEKPPQVLRTSPSDKSKSMHSKKISIYFDEFVKIAEASQRVIVSPPQMEMPDIKAVGKKITIELKDSLKPNTTYTIDFCDAITDYTEDNPMGNYTYSFSTGEQIDTLEVSGFVLDAVNLEPVKGILVGLYNQMEDSIFRKQPMLRVARTDGNGHFTIKGVADGEYRIYALQDMDDNYCFSQKSERIAFTHETFRPSVSDRVRQDTVWKDALHIDSIVQIPYKHFLPDDIMLLSFQEEQTGRYLLKTERKEANCINVFFSYGNPQLPVIKGLNFDADNAFLLESNAAKDSLSYWLRDTTLVNKDTLRFSMAYLMTDTLGNIVTQTDTIEALAKTSYAKRQKAKQKAYEQWKKEQEKKKKDEKPYDSIYPAEALVPVYQVSAAMDPDRSIYIEMPTPLARLDTAAIHLYSMVDSLWYRAPFEFHRCDSMLRRYEMTVDWHEGREYSFEVDSAAFVDIYGLVSKEFKQGIKVKTLDDYASIDVHLSGVNDSLVIVQLVNSGDNVVKQAHMNKDGVAQFFYVIPGTYYLRAFTDRNNNGIWDTGLYDKGLQPEDVYYFPEAIEAKAKYDLTQQWNVTALPRNRQKPGALIKQKAEAKKMKIGRNAERAQQLGIEYKP